MKSKVIDFLKREVELEHVPGAVIYISQNGKEILKESVGFRNQVNGEKIEMSPDTVFDLASLTKVVATLPLVMILIDEGLLSLHEKVADILPEFEQNNKEDVSIYHLLTHTSGLISHRPYFQTMCSREEVLSSIYKEKLQRNPGEEVIYSDLGFILLQKIVEVISNRPFELFFKENISDPLGMNHTKFNPTYDVKQYAATEYSQSLSTRKAGIVHDDNTEIMGGISGHAGLFSTIEDLIIFSEMIENDGCHNNKQILSKSAVQLTKRNHTSLINIDRGLGWSIKGNGVDSCGDYFTENSFGHTGFTGTSIWFDPEVKLTVIILTNRVYFGRNLDYIKARPKLHNLIRRYF